MRRISKNGFGILTNCWHVFKKPFSVEPEKVKVVTLAAITNHNWLLKDLTHGKVYLSPNLYDSEVLQTEI